MSRLAARQMGATAPYPSVSVLFNGFDNTPGISRSFTGVFFSTPRLRRRIGVFVHINGGAGSPSLSVSIGGITATLHAVAGGGNNTTWLFSAEVPTGSTGTISLNFSNGVNNCAISAFALYDAKTAAPEEVSVASELATAVGASVTALNGAVVIAAAIAGAVSNSAWSGSGVAEQSDTDDGTLTWTTARRSGQASSVVVSPTVTWTGANFARLIVVSWR